MITAVAVSMGVAYPACSAADMIVRGKTEKKRILSPTKDFLPDLFLTELKTRGINVTDTFE